MKARPKRSCTLTEIEASRAGGGPSKTRRLASLAAEEEVTGPLTVESESLSTTQSGEQTDTSSEEASSSVTTEEESSDSESPSASPEEDRPKPNGKGRYKPPEEAAPARPVTLVQLPGVEVVGPSNANIIQLSPAELIRQRLLLAAAAEARYPAGGAQPPPAGRGRGMGSVAAARRQEREEAGNAAPTIQGGVLRRRTGNAAAAREAPTANRGGPATTRAAEAEGEATQPRRGAGRQTTIEEVADGRGPVIDASRYAEHGWSLTISVRGGHVPTGWFDQAAEWVHLNAASGIVSMEVGGRANNRHIQGAMMLHAATDARTKAALTKMIKAFIGIRPGMKGHVDFKPFEQGQQMDYMIGYCQKDTGQPHYQMAKFGISDDEAAAAREAYNAVKLDYEDGHKIINRNNIMKLTYQYWATGFKPFAVPLPRILYWMIKSGAYLPSATWVVHMAGKALDMDAAHALWGMITDTKSMRMAHVLAVFYGISNGSMEFKNYGYQPTDKDNPWYDEYEDLDETFVRNTAKEVAEELGQGDMSEVEAYLRFLSAMLEEQRGKGGEGFAHECWPRCLRDEDEEAEEWVRMWRRGELPKNGRSPPAKAASQPSQRRAENFQARNTPPNGERPYVDTRPRFWEYPGVMEEADKAVEERRQEEAERLRVYGGELEPRAAAEFGERRWQQVLGRAYDEVARTMYGRGIQPGLIRTPARVIDRPSQRVSNDEPTESRSHVSATQPQEVEEQPKVNKHLRFDSDEEN